MSLVNRYEHTYTYAYVRMHFENITISLNLRIVRISDGSIC